MRRRAIGVAVALLTLTAACGRDAAVITPPSPIGEPTAKGGDPKIAARAITDFGTELFNAVRTDKNTVVSPVSVAIALSMLEPGANGAGKTELDDALHVAHDGAYHASMTALRQSLESASAPKKTGDYDPGDLQIAISNATYTQGGYPLKAAYLATLGKYYGPVLKTVDFADHGDDAVADINKFIADGTRGHITKVLDEVDPQTMLALVNALYLKASWLEKFDSGDTKREPFTRRDGKKVTADLMHGTSEASTSGAGWVAARKYYSSRLAADFVLPDSARFEEVATKLAKIFSEFDGGTADGAKFVLPKLTTRFREDLRPSLNKLGIRSVYDEGNLMNVAGDARLVVDQAVHATFLAMDEKGTEAAAATVITARAVSARAGTPVPVILDRPFFFRIVDTETGATLFVGQILDPTAG